MDLIDLSVEFYIGAATTGEGAGKWSAPGRDLPYLYRCQYSNSECSLYPDIETWKKYGLVKARGKDIGWRLIKFSDFINHFGEEKVKKLLVRCRGTYLMHQKDMVLDELGCPK